MNISVFIPTYQRVDNLQRCLNALRMQTRLPDLVLLAMRDEDFQTRRLISEYSQGPLNLRIIDVFQPGIIAAHQASYPNFSGDIVAITDDDAAPTPDWLAKIEHYFMLYPDVGGVGGRDILHQNEMPLDLDLANKVGKINRFGNVIGNHHIGTGEVRDVDVLKGVNSSYRIDVFREYQLPACLRSNGTNSHWDLAVSLHAKSLGWRLLYDPALVVNHFQGKRVGMAERVRATTRDSYNPEKLVDSVFNQTYLLLQYLPPARRIVFLLWSILVGSRGRRGLAQCLRFMPNEGILSLRKFLASAKGRWLGWQEYNHTNISTLRES